MLELFKKHYFHLARIGLILTMAVILYLALMPLDKAPLPEISDKIQHLAAFLVLAFLMDASLPEKPFNIWKTGYLLTYGLFIEILQLQTEHRFFSVEDLVADFAGICLYFLTIPIWKRLPLMGWRWSLASQSQ
ncbi:VanZ family protein [Endozoicomonas arenosclerae]|uniref:VanZ family protein n=1 Tax=Endozoicomonas arenosclerae TaxID=1633495 RepID=UPI0007827084|nr:VanZ family protein [Endozoicomonas arenosclerae]